MPSLPLVTLVASIISAMLISVDVDEFGYTSVNASWGKPLRYKQTIHALCADYRVSSQKAYGTQNHIRWAKY
jgi:hypothetical protein